MHECYGRKVQGIKKTQQKIFKNIIILSKKKIIIQNETKLSEEGKKKSHSR